MTEPDPLLVDNPFATRCIRPGALRFLFPPGESVDQVVACLQENQGWGQILGPHGSGKSALVAALTAALQAAGWHVLLVELHNGQRKLPEELQRLPEGPPPRLVVIDGYEQLGAAARRKIQCACRQHDWGLVVTAHTSVNLPDLYRLTPTPSLAQRIVAELTAGRREKISAEIIEQLYSRHRGDLREMLFGLYDHYEQLRRRCC